MCGNERVIGECDTCALNKNFRETGSFFFSNSQICNVLNAMV